MKYAAIVIHLADPMRTWCRKVMKCTGLTLLLWCLVFVFVLPRPGACEGIEKVSYLLQYGPGVHTVFEQQDTSDKPVVDTKDRVAPTTTTPSTLTSKQTSESSLGSKTSSATNSGSFESSTVSHVNIGELHPTTGVIESVQTDPSPLQTRVNSTVPAGNTQAPKINTVGHEQPRPAAIAVGSTAPEPDRRRNQCRSPVTVLQKLPPLPLPPTLPTFGAFLRSDVMVNLKPRELRTLMSTYIGLIEAYKSFNQQQKRNIAHLEEELARHQLITGRTERLRNTRVAILSK
uniref:Uncharacterized protein n=1 Tax=Anopheles quadriannulatus TaxID=34691 RepID=A0A182X944_ANOQN